MAFSKISLPVKLIKKQYLSQKKKEAPPGVRMDASYMVELAIALPFFAGFLTALLFFFQVLTVQQEIGNALLHTGRELSVLSASECENTLTAKALLLKNLPKDSAAEVFVNGGRLGIALVHSDFSGNYISLQADYQMSLPIGLFGKQKLDLTQKLKCRKWTGNSGDSDGEEIVYITRGGSVYHRKKDCTYLKPSVRAVNGKDITALRNAGGGKYYPCIRCMKNKNPNNMMVYVTTYGNRYHGRRDCSEINHTVLAVRLSEVGNKNACSKCGRE